MSYRYLKRPSVTLLKQIGMPPKFTEKEALDALREFEKYCLNADQKPTKRNYINWRRSHLIFPSAHTIARFDSWNGMRLKAAKNPRVLALNGAEWSSKKCLDAIKEYEAFCLKTEAKPTCTGYDKWQHLQSHAPHLQTIIRVIGGWRLAIKQVHYQSPQP